MSSLNGETDEEMEAEAVRKRDEKEIQNDYNDREGENQDREIEHLILVTHGIGQRLGMRWVAIRFLKAKSTNILQNGVGQLYSRRKCAPSNPQKRLLEFCRSSSPQLGN
jgi:hypothetical protein